MFRLTIITMVSFILGFIAAVELFWNNATRCLARETAARRNQ